MTPHPNSAATIPSFDGATASLVRLAARITGGTEEAVREGFAECTGGGGESVPPVWVEEVVLQSYLFAGFPRALNAAREWRRALGGSGAERMEEGDSYENVFSWRMQGEETCKVVYGRNYEKLRMNIRALHPALDDWMIVEGYGKVLSRPGLDLPRRELCIIAACVAAGQDRQLHSHLHGALNAGAGARAVTATLDCLEGAVDPTNLKRAQMLWARVQGK
jgi:4-carboxymuconolactone decarboxylase